MNPILLKISIFLIPFIFFSEVGIFNKNTDKYDKLWSEVEKLEYDALPKSAMAKVEEIYQLAIKEKNSEQVVKSLIYRLKYTNALEEDGYVKAIEKLESEISLLDEVAKSLAYLLLGTMYMDYYNANVWIVNQRSVTYNYELIDIKTWDKTVFKKNVIKNYTLALNDVLKGKSISTYKELIDGGFSGSGFIPDLYDLAAYTITNRLKSSGQNNYFYYGDSSNDDQKFKDPILLSPANLFTNLPLEQDSLSYNQACLQFFQLWLNYRLEQTDNNEALVFADFQRLDFIRDNLIHANKDKLWEARLLEYSEANIDDPILVFINYNLASYYNRNGNKYKVSDPLTHIYKTDIKKAHEILDETIRKFPKEYYSAECINLRNDIERKNITFTNENIISPSQSLPLKITYKNIDKAYLTVVCIDYLKYYAFKKNRNFDDSFSYLLKNGKIEFDNLTIDLPDLKDFNSYTAEYLLNNMGKGYYVIIMHLEPELQLKENLLAVGDVFVSDLSISSNSVYLDETSYYVFNRSSGQPIQNAVVSFFAENYDYRKRDYVFEQVFKGSTDEHGRVAYKPSKSDRYYYGLRVDVSTSNDFLSQNIHSNSWQRPKQNERVEVKFFTDRAIYRPGQEIHFKGICIDRDSESARLKTNYTTTVSLMDVNRQQVSQLQVKTNDYGSFSGSFVIPVDVLTGSFTISTHGGTHYIQVEEYKRPMFEVNMNRVEGEYRINDDVKIAGRAITYAGSGLGHAQITYTIVRNAQWLRFWYFGASLPEAEEVAFGSFQTEEDGKFEINFKAIAHTDGEITKNIYYTYTITVHITDINGETQSGSSTVLVSDVSLRISSDLPDIIDKSNLDSLRINSNNISGLFVAADVEVEIFKLIDPEILLAKKKWDKADFNLHSKTEYYDLNPGFEYEDELNKRKWDNGKKIFSRKIRTEKHSRIPLSEIKNCAPGSYRLILKSTDKWGNEINEQKEFIVFDSKSKKMPIKATDLFYADKFSAQPGETVSVYLGSSYRNVHVLFEQIVKGEVVKREVIEVNNELQKIQIPIEESHRGGSSISLMFIKNGVLYSFSHHISVDWRNRLLNLKLITFRDKTLPGSEENWKIRISDAYTKKHEAELLAGMYDASLDVFASNFWSWSIMPYYYSYSAWSQNSFSFSNSTGITRNFHPEYVASFKQITIPSFKTFGFSYYSYSYDSRYRKSAMPLSESGLVGGVFSADQDESFELQLAAGEETTTITDMTAQSSNDGLLSRNEDREDSKDSHQMQLRSNFNETAFFYPHLRTDEKGEIHISFTVPESLTRWNFLAFAHSKDLKMGSTSHELITQKELMISPNLPRFFRENDKMYISARISNISDNRINGSAEIEIFDPVTTKIINPRFKVSKAKTKFDVESERNVSVSWEIEIPEGLSMVGVRVFARGASHSDGEERIIPILTNRMLVTETMPLPVRKAGTTHFTMNRLKDSGESSSLRHHRLSLEFTSNPAWYAVQALPYLIEYPYECAEQIFSRYYANSLATHIANSDPKIKRVFELWRDTPDSKALLSNLEKNQELKSLLLEETPWVLQAKDETERKRRIGLLFDLNKMSLEMRTATKQLESMQKHNGGWPWFEGMPESWYISQHIICGFGKLDRLGVSTIKQDRSVENMIKKAISFIDGELAESYRRLKIHCKDKCLEQDNISYMHIHYLYTRSFFIEQYPIDRASKEAYEYYLGQAQKYWTNKNFFMQGMIAISLNRLTKSGETKKIMASLKEHSLNHDELGMYWKYDRGYFWYQAPIETQALLIEAFDEVVSDTESVDAMKVWLLKQKQTQDWKTTKATVEAIYALLLRGTEILSNDEIALIKIGKIVIDPTIDPEIRTEAGTGYYKKSWDGSEVNTDMANVSVTKSTNDVAWGAIYWQYFEQLDKITDFEETPLKINKRLFVERRSNDKKVIVPIDKDDSLKLGDRVKVRIEIRVDRDMEYVHLKDMRAACFEPVDVISGYRYLHGLGYYQGIKDASMNFFISYLRKGTYVFEYELVVSQKGDFSNGITTIQCMYAPEFTSHSEGVRVIVN